MARSDNYRPSAAQITNHYTCGVCRSSHTSESFYGAPSCCGQEMSFVGESYPGNSDEWDEQRDPDGEWRQRRY